MWLKPSQKVTEIFKEIVQIYIQVVSFIILIIKTYIISLYTVTYRTSRTVTKYLKNATIFIISKLLNITSFVLLCTYFLSISFVYFLVLLTIKIVNAFFFIIKICKKSINKQYLLIKGLLKIKRVLSKKLKNTSLKTRNIIHLNLKINVPLVLRISLVSSSFLLGLLFATLFYFQYIYTLPDVKNIAFYKPKLTTYFYDKNGNLLYKTYKDENRTLVKLKDLSSKTISSIISIEDSEFYNHQGISFPSIVRASYANYKNKDYVQGGSTITQQLVKNILLTGEKTVDRKIKEGLLAIIVEQNYSKDQILEMYLNTVSFGGTAYGIEAASNMYFGKSSKRLTLAESSMLAGLPAAPSEYSPYIDKEKSKTRQRQVLDSMVENKYITKAEADDAYSSELKIIYPVSIKKYPHFTDYVSYFLSKKYGDEVLQNGGLKVYTTLDPEIQNRSQEIVKNSVDSIKFLNISNGAALVLKNDTGEIKAMVGSKDFYASDIDGFVNVTTSLRQPGSSIKPFNYSLGFENGLTPASIISDEPVIYKTNGSEPYIPKNYDGKFRGNVTVRRALANSLNIPSVKTLEKNGVNNFITYIKKFGITTWNNDYYGLSLALGAAEVKMTELANAYSVFANNGMLIPINPILYIENSNGDIIDYNPCIYSRSFFKTKRVIALDKQCGTRIISTGNAFLIKSILTDFKTREEAFGISMLNVPGTAVKTGTTNDLKDNWAFGFNNEYTVAAWVGNNDSTPMSYVASGITGASPIWADIIETLTNETNKISITKQIPSDVVVLQYCSATAQLACSKCDSGSEYFIKGYAPKNSCNSGTISDIIENLKNKHKKKD